MKFRVNLDHGCSSVCLFSVTVSYSLYIKSTKP